jgi:hypothetical protein
MLFKKIFVGIFVSIVTISILACNKNESSLTTEIVTNLKEEESVENGEDDLLLTIETVDISDIEKGKTYQEIKYPLLEYKENGPLKKSIEDLNKKEREKAERFKEDNKTFIRDYIKEFNNNDAMHSYDASITCTYQNDKYLSLLNNTYIFTMGAHGITVINGYTYDAKTGKELKLSDFVKDREELRKFLKDWVNKQEEGMFYPEAEENIDMYFEGENELQFVLIDNELHVIFQQYDVAPYAAGIIEVKVDESLLKVELN